MKPISVVDLFAGPGGLGEGFASAATVADVTLFDIVLSIEMDSHAHQTLELRSFFRQFDRDDVPEDFYSYCREEIDRDQLFSNHPKAARVAREVAWNATLGESDGEGGVDPELVRERIEGALGIGSTSDTSEHWVLIGGPPCQAYSVIGRPKLRSLSKDDFGRDHRHQLYREYLRIIADHAPSIFVMENVKGLLSSRVNGVDMFEKIRGDLQDPGKAIGSSSLRPHPYTLFTVIAPRAPGQIGFDDILPALPAEDFVVRCEEHGIPQARHRVILIGIRDDLLAGYDSVPPWDYLERENPVSLLDAIDGLPSLRSGISKETDGAVDWMDLLKEFGNSAANRGIDDKTGTEMAKVAKALSIPEHGRGSEFVDCVPGVAFETDWYLDSRLEGVPNHSTRGHMRQDLERYFFLACYARAHERSPRLADFPDSMLPNHANRRRAQTGSLFSDRFRVLLPDRPSVTITSHISKDGHYYIHPDPAQCRSLTVREAARIQTFPDNYFFEGPRTEQYRQVGNAVPPLLAKKLAASLGRFLRICPRARRPSAGYVRLNGT